MNISERYVIWISFMNGGLVMKKLVAMGCVLVMLVGMCISAHAETIETPFDNFAQGEMIIIENGFYTEDRTPGEIEFYGNKELFQVLIKAWSNLLKYEVDQGANVNKTVAADIYRCFKNGYGVGAFCATNPYTEFINLIFGTTTKKANKLINVYWLEWNTETQVIRFAKKEIETITSIKSYNDIMNNSDFFSMIQPSWVDWLNLNPIQSWWDNRSSFTRFMDETYSRANRGKKPGIK